MHIALFGGSFDPAHHGHLQVALTLINQKIVDQVWYVPVKQHPFQKQLSSENHRLAMLRLVIKTGLEQLKNKTALQICTHELEKDQPNYSFETLTELQNHNPEHTFSWVIGSDNVLHFMRWNNWEKLLKNFTVYVYPRHGFGNQTLLAGMKLLQAEEVCVSATEIRQRIAVGEPITDLVTPEVGAYIKAQHLYVTSSH